MDLDWPSKVTDHCCPESPDSVKVTVYAEADVVLKSAVTVPTPLTVAVVDDDVVLPRLIPEVLVHPVNW